MKSITQKVRTALLMSALAVAALAFAAGDATAEKSCFYYCGQSGAVVCNNAPASLSCTHGYLPP